MKPFYISRFGFPANVEVPCSKCGTVFMRHVKVIARLRTLGKDKKMLCNACAYRKKPTFDLIPEEKPMQPCVICNGVPHGYRNHVPLCFDHLTVRCQ